MICVRHKILLRRVACSPYARGDFLHPSACVPAALLSRWSMIISGPIVAKLVGERLEFLLGDVISD